MSTSKRPVLPHPTLPDVFVVLGTRGYQALVDAEDVETVGQYNWRAKSSGHRKAVYLRTGGHSRPIFLHDLLGRSGKGEDSLDFRRSTPYPLPAPKVVKPPKERVLRVYICPERGGGFRLALKGYKDWARRRDLPFELSSDQVWEMFKLACTYCGDPPGNTMRRGLPSEFKYSGLDRSDNALGYVEGNVVPCCKTCNWAKQKMSLDGFYSWVRRVSDRIPLGPM